MEAFTMEIAGLTVRVQPLFESTREYCRPYLTEKAPVFSVAVKEEDLVFQQLQLEKEAIEEGIKLRKFTGPFLERTTIQRRVADRLLEEDTLMLHGSTVAVDGCGYLFTGPCGTGKSTHTRLWRELFGERAVMVNDDMPFLRITPQGALAYGSPWSGKHGLATNICVPLRGICFLRRGKENLINRVDAQRGLGELRCQMHAPTDPSLQEKAAALGEMLSKTVPLWELYCNTDPEAARVSYSAMKNADS